MRYVKPFLVLAVSAVCLLTTPLRADPSSAASEKPVDGTTQNNSPQLDPQEMGKKFEALLNQMAATGNGLSKEAYGIDLKKEMNVAEGEPQVPAKPPGSQSPEAFPEGTQADGQKILQDTFDKSMGLAAGAFGILGTLAEADLAEMKRGQEVAPKPSSPSKEKSEELTGQGTMRALLGDVDGSINLFQQAISLNPENGTAFYNLSCAYARQGNAALSIVPLQKAIAIDGKYLGMAKRDSDFNGVSEDSQFRKLLKP